MMMKKILLTVLAIVIASVALQAKDYTVWQSGEFVADGNAEELGDFMYFDEETGLNYSIKNDSANLYLVFKTAEQMKMMKMLRSGMEIQIKTSVKPKIKATFSFPVRAKRPEPNESDREKFRAARMSGEKIDMIKLMAEKCDLADADNFQYTNGPININEKKGYEFALGFTKWDELVYEVKIPLTEIFGNDFNLEAVIAKPVKIEISILGMQMKDLGQGQGGRRGGFGGGPGGPPPGGGAPGSGHPGGRPGGSGGFNPDSMSEMFAEDSFKMKIYLVSEPGE
jgi:hypothetical protein